MRWLAALTPLRIALLVAAGYLLFIAAETPDWMPASQEYAVEWRETLSEFNSPEEAKSKHKQIVYRRFDNGDWVFGVCRDSLGILDGGAIVVKDSTGRVRVMFGQGSAGSTLADVMADAKSLSDFHKHETWTILQFKDSEF